MIMSREEWQHIYDCRGGHVRNERLRYDSPYGEENIILLWDLFTEEYHKYIALLFHGVSESFMLSKLSELSDEYQATCLAHWEHMKSTGKSMNTIMYELERANAKELEDSLAKIHIDDVINQLVDAINNIGKEDFMESYCYDDENYEEQLALLLSMSPTEYINNMPEKTRNQLVDQMIYIDSLFR